MENRGNRRSRRRSRGIAEAILGHNYSSLYKNKNLYVAGVVFLAFVMLQRNSWKNCNAKQELMKITTCVEDIAKHLNTIQTNYQVMENKLTTYSKELPKLQEQMAALEAIAQVLEVQRFGWNPRIHAPLPYVDVKLNSRNPTRNNPRKKATKFNPFLPGQMNATLIM